MDREDYDIQWQIARYIVKVSDLAWVDATQKIVDKIKDECLSGWETRQILRRKAVAEKQAGDNKQLIAFADSLTDSDYHEISNGFAERVVNRWLQSLPSAPQTK